MISLSGPEYVVAGAKSTLTLVIAPVEDVRIAFVNATVLVAQGWALADDSLVRHHVKLPQPTVRLLDARPLPAGSVTRRDLVVELPDNMAPTHALAPAWAHVEIEVHASIPAGSDYRTLFRVAVRAVTPRVVTRTPGSARTVGAGQTEPRLELSLASARLAAGEVMVGSVAVFHLDDTHARTVELAFHSTLRLINPDRSLYSERAEPPLHRHTVQIPQGGAGRGVAFQIRVPPELTPSFRAVTHELAWTLVARTPGRFLRPLELAMPLDILDGGAAAAIAPLRSAPRLGDARFAGVLHSFASHNGWHAHDDGSISRDGLQLAYEYRGEHGAFLVARCAYPALGLALDVGKPARFGKHAPIGIPAWDQRYAVSARSLAQATPLVRHVGPALLAAGVLGTVASWTDDELVVERKMVSLDAADLHAAGDALAHVAAKLAQGRLLVPPPVEVDMDAMRALAKRLGDELSPGDLAIDGMLDGAPVRLAVELDGAIAKALHVAVGPTATSRDGAVSESIALHGFLDADEVRALVYKLRGDVARLEPNEGPYR